MPYSLSGSRLLYAASLQGDERVFARYDDYVHIQRKYIDRRRVKRFNAPFDIGDGGDFACRSFTACQGLHVLLACRLGKREL